MQASATPGNRRLWCNHPVDEQSKLWESFCASYLDAHGFVCVCRLCCARRSHCSDTLLKKVQTCRRFQTSNYLKLYYKRNDFLLKLTFILFSAFVYSIRTLTAHVPTQLGYCTSLSEFAGTASKRRGINHERWTVITLWWLMTASPTFPGFSYLINKYTLWLINNIFFTTDWLTTLFYI
jgi:hypothetical protein